MLTVSDLHVGYGSVTALNGVGFTAEAGRITCIMGRNGVGKTTLMRAIVGIHRATSGRVALAGTDVTRLAAHQRAKAGIAIVPQGREIFARLSVYDNLLVGLEARRDRTIGVIEEVMTLFPILKQFAKRMGGDLSGGQQQQLAIARALVGSPKVLLLDEPTEGIQPNIIKDIGRAIRTLAARKTMAIVLVEQFYDFAAELADRYLVMERGRIVAQGRGSDMQADGVRARMSI